MLLGSRLKKYLGEQRQKRISGWTRAGIASLLSVIIVLLIAQWSLLFGMVLMIQRAHLTHHFEPSGQESTAIIRPSGKPANPRKSLTLTLQTV